ncbi:hypothetical protein WICMUC_005720 [Wickerhamomyces mucosus]|uniref:Sof1-like protein domain-containing protein n=1 Tax=Wickerhamomyces mucosus TaxID=1378264 RepID=A0A9P8P323_9ASCO|nr:hypothetical protein WICMUC_005720 [Wickerhamomyces mucosus]
MFAKPFIGQLGNGHRDGITSISKNFQVLNKLATGSSDGIIKYWDLSTSTELASFKAHYNSITGTSVTPNGQLLSCSDDKTIKLWSVNSNDYEGVEDTELNKNGLIKTYYGEHAFKSLDHHYSDNLFVTAGLELLLWDENKSKPISNLSWGPENCNFVKFNKTEKSIFASSGSDNSIILYDIRTNSPIQKLIQTMRTNSIDWNPIEAFNFVIANEDHNLYYYDMRYMKKALNVFKDHVAAVLDVDFAPTGQEIVTGSYDKTIRIFNIKSGHSRDIYHTKRMQHVTQIKYSMDSKYIISGSDDGNIRLWRSIANDRSNVKSNKLRTKLEYDNALKERFKNMPEIKRISRHRHVPIVVKKAKEIKNVEIQSLKKREENERRHSKPGSKPYKSERSKQIVGMVFKNDEIKTGKDKGEDVEFNGFDD